MARTEDRIIYGIHSLTPYRLSDGLFYGILKAVGSADIALNAEQNLLYAGSSKFPIASESGTVATEISVKVKALPGFLFELFLGATVTDVGADAAGAVSTLTNVKGSLVAATGLASVGVIPTTGAANLKFGRYVVKALSSTTVEISMSSDINADRGTDVVYANDSLKVAGPLTITMGGNTDIAELGLRLVGGASAIALVTGDTATFEVIPPSASSTEIIVGKTSSTMPEFGCIILSQKRSTGEFFEINLHKCVGSGLPLSLEEMAFSEPELKMTALLDIALDRVFTIRHAKV